MRKPSNGPLSRKYYADPSSTATRRRTDAPVAAPPAAPHAWVAPYPPVPSTRSRQRAVPTLRVALGPPPARAARTVRLESGAPRGPGWPLRQVPRRSRARRAIHQPRRPRAPRAGAPYAPRGAREGPGAQEEGATRHGGPVARPPLTRRWRLLGLTRLAAAALRPTPRGPDSSTPLRPPEASRQP